MENEVSPNVQPNSIREINLTLGYMQKGMDVQALQLKEISQKIDLMAANYVQVTDFATLRHNVVTKEEFAEHLKADADHEDRIRKLEAASQSADTVKKIVYGLVAIVLMSFIGAIWATVIGK